MRTGPLVLMIILFSACAVLFTDIVEFGSLEVHTVTRSGAPVTGSELVLYNDVQVMSVGLTDTNGIHRFDFVPPQFYGISNEPPKGHWRIEDLVGGPSTAYIDGITIEEGDQKSFSFTFLRVGPGQINVSVMDSDGIPIEKTQVLVYGSEGTLSEKVVGPSGLVSFDSVSFGNRGVRVVPPRSYLDIDEGFFFQHGLIIDEDWTEEVNFVLEKCLGTIRASVQDASGAPVEGHPLRLYSSTETLEMEDTGVDGLAVFDSIDCGAPRGLELTQTPEWFFEEGRGLSFYDGISVTQGSDQTFSFSVERCSGEIGVRVEDEGGTPVSGAGLELYAGGRTWDEGVTGSDGLLSFTEACGMEIGVRVIPPTGYTVPPGRGFSFYDGLRPDLDGRVDLVFRLQAS